MRRTLAAICLVAVAVALVLAPLAAFSTASFYSSGATGISVTSVNSTVTFVDNGTSAAIAARWVLIRSRSTSANTCHYKLGSTTAATTDTRLEPGASVSIKYEDVPGARSGWSTMGAICAGGQTATFDVDAGR